MSPSTFLWPFFVYASITIGALIVSGVAAALHRAGTGREEIWRIARQLAIVLGGWVGLMMLLGQLGMFRATREYAAPLFPIAVLTPIVVGVIALRLSTWARTALANVPQSWLVGVQAYRGLGGVFLILSGMNLLPREFATPAGYGDVLVGVLAVPIAAYWAAGLRHRDALVTAWNLLGLADLIVALATGFLSSPTPFQMLALDRPNLLMSSFPMVLIPTFAVPLSIVLHIASLTKQPRRQLPAREAISPPVALT